MTRALTLLVVTLTLAACGATPRYPDPAAERALPPVEVAPLAPGTAHERFIAFGDWGTGRPGQRQVAAAMATWARRDGGVAFLLTVGDNFYPRGVASLDDPHWRETFEEVYDDPALAVPLYVSLGNHDHKGDPDAQVAYGRRNPRWVMPARHYEVVRALADGTTVHLFAIDSEVIQGDPAQVRWLDEALGASTARWKVVFGHHPLYARSKRGPDAGMIALLEPLFVRHGVDLYLAGHDHVLELLQPKQGVHYVVTGAGGGVERMGPANWTSDTIYTSTGGGFVGARVSRDELLLEFVRETGRTQFAYALHKAPLDGAEAPAEENAAAPEAEAAGAGR
ncbi:MAG: tartrate-resistant acid phosphatase type 5 family protein [Planctomycetes bacterium]|nr:tartrate-resistant acid phosphatase type 5 family protein [Planctomycetota bacterium]